MSTPPADKKPTDGKGFPPGTSGNPKGRPKGSLNKATLLARKLLDGEAAAITSKAIELAKEGDHVALKLCFERLLPPMKERPLQFAMPEKTGVTDIAAAYERIFLGLSEGTLSLGEASGLANLFRAKLEAQDVERIADELSELQDGLSK